MVSNATEQNVQTLEEEWWQSVNPNILSFTQGYQKTIIYLYYKNIVDEVYVVNFNYSLFIKIK